MSQGLYREVSLERLSSPEQLDERIKVTSPRAWFALIGISCILLSAVVWGFLGSIPTKIEGHGILLHNGGVVSVQHHTSGQVIDIRFRSGEVVKRGDVVARIEVPQLVMEINNLQSILLEMKNNNQVDSVEYMKIEKQVEELQEKLLYQSQVVSQVDGRILEVKAMLGTILQPGDPVLTLDQYGGTVKIEAIVYISAEEGGGILPGMEAQISPTIVNKEEYGYMIGSVSSVSEYPATTQSMMQTLGNESLVSLLAARGASLIVRIDLFPDSSKESGYRWSSPKGPPMIIHSGTIVEGAVIIHRERPVHKVLPLLKKSKSL